MTSASERIQWAELDKRKFFMYGPTLFVLVRAAVYPASLVKTRLQVQAGRAHYNGIMDAFSKIVRLEGVRGLYKGFGTNAWTLASGQVYITLLEIIRGQLLPQRMSESARSFIAGGSASLLSQTVMVPLDVVSQRLMMQGQGGVYTAEQPRFRGGLHLATHIVQTQGVRGLYRGYWASVATYAPTSAVWWSMYCACPRRGCRAPACLKCLTRPARSRVFGRASSAAAGQPKRQHARGPVAGTVRDVCVMCSAARRYAPASRALMGHAARAVVRCRALSCAVVRCHCRLWCHCRGGHQPHGRASHAAAGAGRARHPALHADRAGAGGGHARVRATCACHGAARKHH